MLANNSPTRDRKTTIAAQKSKELSSGSESPKKRKSGGHLDTKIDK